MRRSAWIFVIAVGAASATAGCAGGSASAQPTVTVTVRTTTTVTATPSPASPTPSLSAAVAKYPSGDAVLPGYPVLVNTSSLDYRPASAIKTDKAVAVAPGVYAAYSPTQTNLEAYLRLPNDGDCAVRAQYFPRVGGTCWNGVPPGSEEPQQ